MHSINGILAWNSVAGKITAPAAPQGSSNESPTGKQGEDGRTLVQMEIMAAIDTTPGMSPEEEKARESDEKGSVKMEEKLKDIQDADEFCQDGFAWAKSTWEVRVPQIHKGRGVWMPLSFTSSSTGAKMAYYRKNEKLMILTREKVCADWLRFGSSN